MLLALLLYNAKLISHLSCFQMTSGPQSTKSKLAENVTSLKYMIYVWMQQQFPEWQQYL